MLLKGRKKIVSSFKSSDLLEFSNLAKALNASRITHLYNKVDIDYLIEYKKGQQPILDKVKPVRPEVNNIIVANHAQMITRNIVGYFLGTPIQYIQNGASTNKDDLDFLNKCVAYEDKPSVDNEIGEYQSTCGTAYRIIYTDGALADEVPFEEKALNPSNTYVVYENNVTEKPLFGVTYFDLLDENNGVVGLKLYVYTEFGMYELETDSSGLVNDTSIVDFQQYNIGGVPIIEYPNNMWRIGDWELCLGIMEAINKLDSGRLDDIDQIVQSLLVFINADIDADKYDEMREAGVVVLKNNSGNPSSVDTISNTLDQSGMNMFSEELQSLLYALVGIPDRNNRKGGGGDTGQAVELRDGWADMEIVARNKEGVFKKSEKMALRIILNIMNAKAGTKLSLMDVDIKFSRNKSNNLLVKTQGLMNLLGTKILDPADCLSIVDLVSDVNEYIDRGKTFWGDSFAGLVKENTALEHSQVNLDNAKNPVEEPPANQNPPKEGE